MVQKYLFRFIIVMLFIAAVIGMFKYFEYRDSNQFSEYNRAEPVFVELDPIRIPVIVDDQVIETRSFTLVVETRDGGPYRVVLKQAARLHDLYTYYMLAFATRSGRDGLDNLSLVKKQLMIASSRHFGPYVVYGVLLKEEVSNMLPYQ